MLKRYFDHDILSSCDLFATLVQHSPDYIYTKDSQFRYLSINAAGAAVIGKAAHEILGQDDFFIFPPDEAKAIRETEEAMLSDGRSRTIDEAVTLRGRAVRLSTARNVIRDFNGRIVGVVGISRDVTDLRNADVALREAAAEERARRAEITLMEAIPAAVFIAHEPQCRNMTGNRTAHALLQVPRDENISKWAPSDEAPSNFEAYVGNQKLSPDELPMQRAATTGKPVRDFEMDLVFEDRSKRTIFGSALPLLDDRGAPRGAVGAFVDVSSYKELLHQLREANQAKDNFLGVLGHELRNPLNALNSCILQMAETTNPEVNITMLRVMQRQLTQLKRLTNDLLDVNRIANGKLDVEKTAIDLRDVMSAAVETSRAFIKKAGQHLTVNRPSKPLIVDGDFARLVQLVTNLLNNAAKFSSPGGHVCITAERASGHAAVRVKDTGIGIEKHMLSSVFDVYTQADQSSSRTYGGLGIGLALVKCIAELHDGTVQVRSDGPDTGSEFIVQLPVIDDQKFI